MKKIIFSIALFLTVTLFFYIFFISKRQKGLAMPKTITKENYEQEVISSKQPVIINVYADVVWTLLTNDAYF